MTQRIGPFTQLLTMDGLPEAGPISDSSLKIITNGGILVDAGRVVEVGKFDNIQAESTVEIEGETVALPGFVDSHTHICFAGSRARDYALRVEGLGYQEIAERGGGILDTVRQTRAATLNQLTDGVIDRVQELEARGVTTIEVKSGYGLSVDEELKMLRAIHAANQSVEAQLITTCLAAHTKPWEFETPEAYLEELRKHLLPGLSTLTRRVDIFVEEGAFPADIARPYLLAAKDMGFDITVHSDQFSRGAALLAAEVGAVSADHLEVSEEEDLIALRNAGVVATVLPGASLGLGLPFAPARKALDLGLCVAIASDWNPGSAPMGDLLTQAALLGAGQHLTMAETLAGITVRGAKALGLKDRGVLRPECRADLVLFPCTDYREILYHQGNLYPSITIIGAT